MQKMLQTVEQVVPVVWIPAILCSGNKGRSAQVVPAMQDQPGVKEDPSQDREDSGVIKFDPRNVDGCSWPSIHPPFSVVP